MSVRPGDVSGARTYAQPSAPLLDSYAPADLEPGLYYADGQIDGEVFEYGSFVQSRMYHAYRRAVGAVIGSRADCRSTDQRCGGLTVPLEQIPIGWPVDQRSWEQ
jgi:hypothetical protein